MKRFTAAFILVGCLGSVEGHAQAGSCPTTNNVTVINNGAYPIVVTGKDCGEDFSDTLSAPHSRSFKAREGSYIEFALPGGGGSCKKQVPVGKEIEITSHGLPSNPSCESR